MFKKLYIKFAYNFCQHLGKLLQQGSHLDGFLAGAAGGVTAAAITYPLDTIRARLAFQVTSNTLYSGIKHAAIRMLKEVNNTVYFYLQKI